MTIAERVEKTCSKCNIAKDLEQFALHSSGKHGRARICKECKCLYTRNYYDNNRDKIIKRTLEYRANNWDKIKAAAYRYRNNNKFNHQARQAVNNAVIAGKFIKTNCNNCSLKDTEFHHTNGYDKQNWFVGMWLCYSCHGLIHRKERI